jgi:hypothetical protein
VESQKKNECFYDPSGRNVECSMDGVDGNVEKFLSCFFNFMICKKVKENTNECFMIPSDVECSMDGVLLQYNNNNNIIMLMCVPPVFFVLRERLFFLLVRLRPPFILDTSLSL